MTTWADPFAGVGPLVAPGCTYPGARMPSEVTLDQCVAQNTQNSSNLDILTLCYNLHNFNLTGDPDLAFFDWFQVPGATCSGGGHLPTPAWALGNHRNPCRLLWTRLRGQNQPQIRGEKSPKMKVKIWKGVWVKTYCFLAFNISFYKQRNGFRSEIQISLNRYHFFLRPPKNQNKAQKCTF